MIIIFDFKDFVILFFIKYFKLDLIIVILVFGWILFVWFVKIYEGKVKIFWIFCSNVVFINLIF